MLASVFNKSRPVNYILIAGTLVTFYILYTFNDIHTAVHYKDILLKAGLMLLLAAAVFLVNFITKKNTLSRSNTYAMFLFLVFLILFPTIMVNTDVIIANFFLLLALRRLISLQSLIAPKEKIFDASFWIFAAAIFHFWCIIYIVLVFISIIFHVSRDYRNWIIPFIAFFGVAIIYSMIIHLTGESFIAKVDDELRISFDFTYFENIYQNIALALFSSIAALFAFTQIISINSRPLNMQSSYKKIVFSFLIGVGIYVLSADKNNSFLAFSFAPLAIMGANYLESQENYWFKESLLSLIVLSALFIFFAQL